MKTITTKVYTLDELDEEAKEKARDWWREVLWDDCYKSICEDANSVGIEITEFDSYSNQIAGKFTKDACYTAYKAIDDRGDFCETYKTSAEFLKERDAIIKSAPLDQKLNECEDEYLWAILEDYLLMLRQDYEYIQGDWYIDETILANEYTFTATGSRFV